MEKLMPSHDSSYVSYQYQLLDNTKSKRLESWDRVYTVHYLVDDNDLVFAIAGLQAKLESILET